MKKFFPKKIDAVTEFYWICIVSIPIILVCSIIFLVSDYVRTRADVEGAIKNQNDRARSQFAESLAYTKYVTEIIGRQVLVNYASSKSLDHQFIDNVLIGYRKATNDLILWSTFSWADKNHKLVVSSNVGVMKEAIDMSHRDYIPLTSAYPNIVHIGKPVIGVVSKLWSIPAGYGVVDQKGEYLGAVITGVVIDGLKDRIANALNDSKVAFAIIDPKGEILTRSKDFDLEKSKKFIKKLSAEIGKKTLQYGNGFYQKIDGYPYGIATFYTASAIETSTVIRLCIYIILVSLISLFACFYFFIFYKKLLMPILELSALATKISCGEKLYHKIPTFEIYEINELAKAVKAAAKKNDD